MTLTQKVGGYAKKILSIWTNTHHNSNPHASWTAGLNKFSDMDMKEFTSIYCGCKPPPDRLGKSKERCLKFFDESESRTFLEKEEPEIHDCACTVALRTPGWHGTGDKHMLPVLPVEEIGKEFSEWLKSLKHDYFKGQECFQEETTGFVVSFSVKINSRKLKKNMVVELRFAHSLVPPPPYYSNPTTVFQLASDPLITIGFPSHSVRATFRNIRNQIFSDASTYIRGRRRFCAEIRTEFSNFAIHYQVNFGVYQAQNYGMAFISQTPKGIKTKFRGLLFQQEIA
ncbi:hypothetical protein SELMODRAFT_419140 [Selaginella moellendorffii]|uniref:Uncharacterized protein n=1 Tax=Selaginella moellendorffii TaxID=88036 RepID=D8S7Z1_SELML|nr:hypothetical protein SELMODRAFT_419140 [Selaginella moellendorffii]